MALPVVVFLLALTSLSAASAPDCKDLVEPFIPEDPKLVGFLSLIYPKDEFEKAYYQKAHLDIFNIAT